MSGRLDGKIAVVTGASRGLGRHCALAYAAEGATVVPVARSSSEAKGLPGTLEETARAIEEAGGTAWPIGCDMGDPEAIRAMIGEVIDRFGRIDVLMTNAVYYAPGTISTMDPDDWELQFRVNVHGVFHAIRAALPSMIERRSGNIITISSIAAERASHYGVTKRAVAGMTLAFAEEQRANGIAVNSLRPVAAIETPGWLNARPPEARQARAHRVSPPDSYVEAAILLAMRSADECTGEALTDADVLKRFGAPGSFERFASINAPVWSGETAGR